MDKKLKSGPSICWAALYSYMELLIQSGVNKERVEHVTGISLDQLTEPDARVPLSLLVKLEKESPILAKDSSIGLKLGQICLPNKYHSGIVGHVAAQCPTIGEGFRQAIRYSNLLSENLFLQLREGDDFAEFLFSRNDPEYFSIQSVELALANAAILLRMRDHDFRIEEAHFTYPAPDHQSLYHQVFGSNIHFNQEENKIVFPVNTLKVPNIEAQPYLKKILLDHASKLISETKENHSYCEKVRSQILDNLEKGNIGIEDIARDLNTSRQTMYRRLKEEHITFQELLDKTRKTMASQYIKVSEYTMTEIAFLLGFSEASSFYRAYKRWFGRSLSKHESNDFIKDTDSE